MKTLLPLWACFNPNTHSYTHIHTHPYFCDVFNYVSPGTGDSELLITLLSSLQQNYSTKRESSRLTMQLRIPTMCQNYDAIYSLFFYFNSLVASSLLQISLMLSFLRPGLFVCHPFLSCAAWSEIRRSSFVSSVRVFISGQQPGYNLMKCLQCFHRNVGQKRKKIRINTFQPCVRNVLVWS